MRHEGLGEAKNYFPSMLKKSLPEFMTEPKRTVPSSGES